MKFCSGCGSSDIEFKVPEGGNVKRYFCNACATVFYQNPKIIAGCILEWQNKILLCRRSIEPRIGFWTVPAGFMENKESVCEAASRESWEEAYAYAEQLHLHSIYSLKHANQVYMMYRGILKDGKMEAGEETSEVALYEEQDIPWNEIAFPVVSQMLKLYFKDRVQNKFCLHEGELNRNGSGELEVISYD